MAEYISRDDTLLHSEIIRVYSKDYGNIDVVPVEYLADIPAADVQPVKRGRWINIYEWAEMHDSRPSGMCTYYWCSECEKEQEKKSDFCPNCGARMDGDTNG